MIDEIETLVGREWLNSAGVIFTALQAAYAETERILIDNPLLRHRNQANIQGQLRYFLSATVLDHCVEQGRIPGITSTWVSQGCEILVLKSSSFEVQLAHTPAPDQKPKMSQRRELATVSNQLLLEGILPEKKSSSQEALMQLFLLHGNKNLNFVNLACPDSLDREASYVYLSPNFATMPRAMSDLDVEEVQEALPKLSKEIIERLRAASNE